LTSLSELSNLCASTATFQQSKQTHWHHTCQSQRLFTRGKTLTMQRLLTHQTHAESRKMHIEAAWRYYYEVIIPLGRDIKTFRRKLGLTKYLIQPNPDLQIIVFQGTAFVIVLIPAIPDNIVCIWAAEIHIPSSTHARRRPTGLNGGTWKSPDSQAQRGRERPFSPA
jgi:hypothetical protein